MALEVDLVVACFLLEDFCLAELVELVGIFL